MQSYKTKYTNLNINNKLKTNLNEQSNSITAAVI